MATVADTLKVAVLEQDWDKVCLVYRALTGETIEPPKKVQTFSVSDLARLDIGDALGLPDEAHEVEIEDEEEDDEEEDSELPPLWNYYYACEACGHSFGSEKERKRCVVCRKQKLVAVPFDDDIDEVEDDDPQTPDEKPPAKTGAGRYSDFIAKSKGDEKNPFGQRVNEEGKIEARKIPFTAKVRLPGTLKSKWQDDGTLEAEDSVKHNPKLGVQKITPRGRRDEEEDTSHKVTCVCSLCKTSHEVTPLLARGYDRNPDANTWKCNDCCGSKRVKKGRDR